MSSLSEQLAALPAEQTYASLTVTGKDDLTPVAAHTQLTSVSLWGACPELSPLFALPKLEELRLYKPNAKVDLSPLARCPSLQVFAFSGPVTEAQAVALSALPGLRSLWVEGGEAHLGALGASVVELGLAGNKVEDLSPIAHLDLTQLHVGGRRSAVRELGPLAGMRRLETLSLQGAQVEELAPLAGLVALKRLALDGVKTLRSLAGLEGLSALEELNLNLTGVGDLTPISGLSRLRVLRLRGAKVKDLEALLGLTALEALYLENSSLSRLDGVAQLRSLQRLQIFDTKVRRLAPLAGHPSLGGGRVRAPRARGATALGQGLGRGRGGAHRPHDGRGPLGGRLQLWPGQPGFERRGHQRRRLALGGAALPAHGLAPAARGRAAGLRPGAAHARARPRGGGGPPLGRLDLWARRPQGGHSSAALGAAGVAHGVNMYQ